MRTSDVSHPEYIPVAKLELTVPKVAEPGGECPVVSVMSGIGTSPFIGGLCHAE